MMNVDLNTPIWKLTVGDMLDIIQKKAQPTVVVNPEPIQEDKYVYGLDGIAKLFNCSKSTAQRIKNSGMIEKAIKQRGRTIVVDRSLALELFGKSQSKIR